ncbi:MAG: hypothetical protein V4488_16775 [Pseudomonadota bacterium]
MLQIFAALSVVAALNTPTQSAINNFCERASADECHQLTDAINASPVLVDQLNEIASAGLLTSFAVTTSENAPIVRNTKFGAAIVDGTVSFTSEFLVQVKKNHSYDVTSPDDVYPNNLVFALGHLAYHAKTARDIKAFEEKWMLDVAAQAKATPEGTPFNANELFKQGQRKHLEDEACAYIQGWNDMLEAAASENGGKPISVRQLPKLLMNFRYGQVFVKSLRQPGNSIVLPFSGMIAMDKHNIDAVVEALLSPRITDVQ